MLSLEWCGVTIVTSPGDLGANDGVQSWRCSEGSPADGWQVREGAVPSRWADFIVVAVFPRDA
jgi:hypothetical protein